jgi:hypothetical protein
LQSLNYSFDVLDANLEMVIKGQRVYVKINGMDNMYPLYGITEVKGSGCLGNKNQFMFLLFFHLHLIKWQNFKMKIYKILPRIY